MANDARYRRRSARVLLLDRDGRILLLRSQVDSTDPGHGYAWLSPGGGVGDGESLPEAAARELHEEVGLDVQSAELGRPVAYSTGYAEFGWASGTFRDDFFCHRVDGHEVDISRMEALERSLHVGFRWWTLDELVTTTDTVYPVGLAGLLEGLLAGRVPRQPVRLTWHH